MLFLVKPKWKNLCAQLHKQGQQHCISFYTTCSPALQSSHHVRELCCIVSADIGSLDDLEMRLNKLTNVPLTSSLVTQVLDSCKRQATATRRLLRFFLWSRRSLDVRLLDEHFNHAIRVFAEMKDFTALDILLSDFGKDGRVMETCTFSLVAETLVKLGREDEALGIFKNLNKFKCPQDGVTVAAIVSALCAKGHAKRAEGVIWHHKDKIFGNEACVYKSLLYGWSCQENVKEARRIIQEMKSLGIVLDLYCFNTFLRCLCKRNLKSNPSALVPAALNVMIEMRTYGVEPTSVSYNILLANLGKTRRVKESLQILDAMRKAGCSPDWVSYYLVARVLYLSGRFGKGKQIVDKMVEEGLVPDRKFYYDLIGILCGVERANYALELLELMKKSSVGGYGPVYDLVIQKLCRGGNFQKGRELWDEAIAMGVALQCSSDVLDPAVTKVFKPVRKVEENVSLVDWTESSTQAGKAVSWGEKKGKMGVKHKVKNKNTASS